MHACGFDSIPHDLGAYFTVQQLPEGVPLTVRGYVRAGGTPSGGTFALARSPALSRARQNIAGGAATPGGRAARRPGAGSRAVAGRRTAPR